MGISQNLESSQDALLVFGNGDGGGGPLAAMLENVCSLSFHLFFLSPSRCKPDIYAAVFLATLHPSSDE
jgi:alpha-mannosidase